jgi:glycerol-3-phosphate acyltransferase PlsY
MELALRVAGTAVGAFLIGSIPWAFIVVRVFWRQDIRSLGSGNAGATNVLRVFGTAPGLSVLFLDAAKGAAAVYLSTVLVPTAWGAAGQDWLGTLGAMAAIAGHSFSPFIGFRGGKGVATAAGAITMLAPNVSAVLFVTFIVVVAVWKMVSLGSVVIAVMFPGVSWLLYRDQTALLVFAVIAAALVIWRHRTNLRRIASGEESKITFKRRMWDEVRSRARNGSE